MKPTGASSGHIVTAWCCYLSGVSAIVGIVFLIALYISFAFPRDGLIFGTINDVAVAIQYGLLIPVAISLFAEFRDVEPDRNRKALLIGVPGMAGFVLLQALLVAGVLAFEVQVGMLLAPFAATVYWFVVTGDIGRDSGRLPKTRRLDILAALYIGFPLWAFRIGDRFSKGLPTEK